MKYEQIKEGLVYGDLEKLVLPKLSIAEYEQRLVTKKMLSLLLFMLKTINLHKIWHLLWKRVRQIF